MSSPSSNLKDSTDVCPTVMTSGDLSFPIIDGISYLVHPQSLAKVVEPSGQTNPIPVVVLTIGDATASVDKAVALINRFAGIDDVYSQSFARTVVLQSIQGRNGDVHLAQFKASGCFSAVYHIASTSPTKALPPGPYFLSQGNVCQAYRLYEDELDSFISGVIPDDVLSPKRYSSLTSLGHSGLWKNIAVPSRLYAKPTPEKPLAGARMGLKDIFRLQGTQLTMMSRPWTELYGPDEESADYTKKLIDLGAVIVGKTKMTSFASPEEPTDQWVDFHCPVNPRGDRYQSPSSSSTGAGTSLAGYDWLDFSIAGDCTTVLHPLSHNTC
ncbi:uncharacterized protein PV07_05045 [Cladophialophora immunda]|uniref:Uncharacterized protein n=1 Tax=Cladophialophora immunda TaxID=569365 RepID=A0A0D2CDJ1_9EURO|nr:uncharacterized protein PV07_05045 [Cladophialophora immunda]KIW29218.1 hypothetical protein PV07_05045 [Cladophialophora immunda]